MVALSLTAVAVGSGVACRDVRARMALAFGVVAVALSFGPAFPGYGVLYEVFPLMRGIRGASRFGQLFLVAIAMLSGFGWARVRQAIMRTTTPTARTVALTLGAAVLIGVNGEATRVPVPYTEYQGMPAVLDELRSTGNGAVLAFFPFYPLEAVYENSRYMLYSTRSFTPMLNGYSGFTPQSYLRHVEALRPFPDPASIDYLREVGVTHVVVDAPLMRDTFLAALDRFPELELAFTDGSLRIYTLES